MHVGFHSATDYLDDVSQNGRFFEKQHLDSLFDGLAALGIQSHEWVIEDRTTLYDDNPTGFVLLAEAVAAAHRHGVALHVVYKPFERIPDITAYQLYESASFSCIDDRDRVVCDPAFRALVEELRKETVSQ